MAYTRRRSYRTQRVSGSRYGSYSRSSALKRGSKYKSAQGRFQRALGGTKVARGLTVVAPALRRVVLTTAFDINVILPNGSVGNRCVLYGNYPVSPIVTQFALGGTGYASANATPFGWGVNAALYKDYRVLDSTISVEVCNQSVYSPLEVVVFPTGDVSTTFNDLRVAAHQQWSKRMLLSVSGSGTTNGKIVKKAVTKTVLALSNIHDDPATQGPVSSGPTTTGLWVWVILVKNLSMNTVLNTEVEAAAALENWAGVVSLTYTIEFFHPISPLS